MKKVLIIIIGLTLIGLVSWKVYERTSLLRKPAVMQRGAIPVAVETKPVLKTKIRDVGLFTGTLYPKAQFIVAPKIAGRLEKLFVNISDPVNGGQLIAVLEDDEHLQTVDQAGAELEVARANLEESRSALEISEREFERAKVLRQKKIASESELDTAEALFKAQSAKHKVAMAQVAQKEAAFKGAKVRLSYTQIHAPWEGDSGNRVVGERFVDEGAMLAPNTSIVSILDIDSLLALIYVIERDYSKVRIGQEGIVSTDAFPGRNFSGKVLRLAPLLKETSRQARVEIEVPNPEGLLKPGMFVRVQIEFTHKENATVVPVSALIKRKGVVGVFLADPAEMKARFFPLTIGIVNSEWAEVVKPSLDGSVVTLGHHLLEEGSTIILPPAKPVGQGTGTAGHKDEEARPEVKR